jgi:enoyl-CoA hydratase
VGGDVETTVLARTGDGVGHLTLNRPRAINALDAPMIGLLAEALDAWEHDTEVSIVLLDGAGERGFCAGGDVRSLREQILAERVDLTAEFFRAEYALNARIAEYPKPIVALADGVTMGAASASRGTRPSASSPSAHGSRCPRRGSASPPTSAARGSSRARRVGSVNTSR